jgi:hypothetical protein
MQMLRITARKVLELSINMSFVKELSANLLANFVEIRSLWYFHLLPQTLKSVECCDLKRLGFATGN